MPEGSERITSLRQQDRDYARLYSAWSSSKDNEYGFYRSSTVSENEYSDTDGFSGMYPAADERDVLVRTTKLVSNVMIMYTALSFALSLLFSGYPKTISGMHMCREGFFIGSGLSPVVASYAVNIVLRLMPICYLLIKTRASIGVMIPIKINNKPLFRHSIFFAFIAFGVLFLCLDVKNAIFGVSRPWKNLMLLETSGKRVAMIVLYCAVIPIFSELLHRGIFVGIFRQYGDGFAMIMSSLLAAAVSSEGDYLFTFSYSLMLSYFVLSTGSVLTALIMRLVISGCYYGITLYRLEAGDILPQVSIALIIVFIGTGLVATIRFIARYSSRISLPIYNLYLTDTEKVMTVISYPPIIVWLTIYTLMNLYWLMIS